MPGNANVVGGATLSAPGGVRPGTSGSEARAGPSRGVSAGISGSTVPLVDPSYRGRLRSTSSAFDPFPVGSPRCPSQSAAPNTSRIAATPLMIFEDTVGANVPYVSANAQRDMRHGLDWHV